MRTTLIFSTGTEARARKLRLSRSWKYRGIMLRACGKTWVVADMASSKIQTPRRRMP
jgi:hypothetical protein